MTRSFDRTPAQMRPVTIEPDYVKYPAGAALVTFGDTRVLCTVTIEESVPGFLRDRQPPQGWLTAEYALMPASGLTRNPRAGYSGQVKGRVHEIQRLIGRSLRAVLDLTKVGPRTIYIDCDVLQADGGTRTAAINGAMVALRIAMGRLQRSGKISENPIISEVAAISVGVVKGTVMMDLDYREDSTAETDLNLVMTRTGGMVEVQGTAEHGVFSRQQLDAMLALGESGVTQLFKMHDEAVARARP